MGYISRAWSDFLGLFCVPLLIALCPARVGMRLSRAWAPRLRSCAENSESSLDTARQQLAVADPVHWRRQFAFNFLRDHVDLYHWLIWGDRWFRRHVTTAGQWPTGPMVVVCYHWGTGLWGLHSLRQATGGFVGVARPPAWQELRQRPVLFAYVRLRTWATHRILGKGLHLPANAARHLVRAVQGGQSICGLFDSPAQPQDKRLTVRLAGCDVRLPRGLPALAVNQRVPVVVFSGEPDPTTGGTRLVIAPPVAFTDADAAAQYLAAELNARIQREPAWWHHWYLCRP